MQVGFPDMDNYVQRLDEPSPLLLSYGYVTGAREHCSWVGTKQLFWNEMFWDRCQRWNTFDKKLPQKFSVIEIEMSESYFEVSEAAESCRGLLTVSIHWASAVTEVSKFYLVVSETAQLLIWDVSKSLQRSQPLWKTAQNTKLRDGRFPRECVFATNLCLRQDGCLGESACFCRVEWRST